MSLPPPLTIHSIHNTLWLVLLESGAQPWTSHCGGNGSFRPLLRWTGRAMWLTHGLSRILWRHRIDKKSRCSLHYFSFQIYFFINDWASLVSQMVKNLPEMQETWVQSLGQEDPLEEGMATHSSVLAWRIPIDRGTWQASPWGLRVRHDWVTNTSTFKFLILKKRTYIIYIKTYTVFICRTWSTEHALI